MSNEDETERESASRLYSRVLDEGLDAWSEAGAPKRDCSRFPFRHGACIKSTAERLQPEEGECLPVPRPHP